MLIDKSKFLFLVGAIAIATAASTGCKAKGSGDDGSGGGDDTTSSSSEGSGTGGSTSSSEGTGGDGGSTSSSEAVGTGGSTSTSESVGSGGGCNDDAGTADACDSTCEGLDNCSSEGYLKPGRYADVVPCFNALPAACSYTDATECLLDSLAGACADATADALATSLAEYCVQSEAEVHAVVDGLNQAGRDVVEADALEFCDGSTYFIQDSASVLLFGPPL